MLGLSLLCSSGDSIIGFRNNNCFSFIFAKIILPFLIFILKTFPYIQINVIMQKDVILNQSNNSLSIKLGIRLNFLFKSFKINNLQFKRTNNKIVIKKFIYDLSYGSTSVTVSTQLNSSHFQKPADSIGLSSSRGEI